MEASAPWNPVSKTRSVQAHAARGVAHRAFASLAAQQLLRRVAMMRPDALALRSAVSRPRTSSERLAACLLRHAQSMAAHSAADACSPLPSWMWKDVRAGKGQRLPPLGTVHPWAIRPFMAGFIYSLCEVFVKTVYYLAWACPHARIDDLKVRVRQVHAFVRFLDGRLTVNRSLYLSKNWVERPGWWMGLSILSCSFPHPHARTR